MEQVAETSRSKKFIKDLGIYAIGNLGSKLITFLLVPFYTFFITDPAAFGYYDICVNTVFCLIPIVGMQLSEGGFRFLIDTKDTAVQRSVITYVSTVLLRNALLVTVVGVMAGLFVDIKYLYLSIAFGLAQTLYDVVLQLVRGLGRTKDFVSAGILNTLLIALTSVLFVAVMDMGIEGVFLSNVMARFLVLAAIELRMGLMRKYFRRRAFSRSLNREIRRYSLPLIPAALCWWFISSNNYYFLQYFRGLADTGYYGFVGRFTGILYILALIFYQTWQQNAIEQYNSPDRDRFFTKVFNNYFYLLTGLVVLFAFGLRLNYFWVIGAEFQSTSKYIFLNAIYVMVFALSSFFELGYQCSKRTRYILPSLVIVAVVNLTCNYFLVQLWGIYGIIVSNILTWGALLTYRAFDTRKFMTIRFNRINFMAIAILVIFGVLYYVWSGPVADMVCLSAFLVLYIALAPDEFRNIILQKLPFKRGNT